MKIYTKLLISSMVFLCIISCPIVVHYHEIEFFVNSKRYFSNDSNEVFSDFGFNSYDFSKDVTLDDYQSYILLSYNDTEKIYFILNFDINTEDVTFDKLVVFGNIDEYFDEAFTYSNYNISFHLDFVSTSPHFTSKLIKNFTFSGTIHVDTSSDSFDLSITEGRAKFGSESF